MIRFVLPLVCIVALFSCKEKGPVAPFDGHSFKGWEGDTVKLWKIKDGAIVGGSLTDTTQHNDFLCTVDSFHNFKLNLKFRLVTISGFANSGVQFRSQRLKDPTHEMTGYQADLGDGYWGSLYDESRRNKTIAIIDSAKAASVAKHGDWNDYTLICENAHIQIFLNGEKTVDYMEEDASIPQSGLIGLQIHGGGVAEAGFKDMTIEVLP